MQGYAVVTPTDRLKIRRTRNINAPHAQLRDVHRRDGEKRLTIRQWSGRSATACQSNYAGAAMHQK
jgi:hypothetical protein